MVHLTADPDLFLEFMTNTKGVRGADYVDKHIFVIDDVRLIYSKTESRCAETWYRYRFRAAPSWFPEEGIDEKYLVPFESNQNITMTLTFDNEGLSGEEMAAHMNAIKERIAAYIEDHGIPGLDVRGIYQIDD